MLLAIDVHVEVHHTMEIFGEDDYTKIHIS